MFSFKVENFVLIVLIVTVRFWHKQIVNFNFVDVYWNGFHPGRYAKVIISNNNKCKQIMRLCMVDGELNQQLQPQQNQMFKFTLKM